MGQTGHSKAVEGVLLLLDCAYCGTYKEIIKGQYEYTTPSCVKLIRSLQSSDLFSLGRGRRPIYSFSLAMFVTSLGFLGLVSESTINLHSMVYIHTDPALSSFKITTAVSYKQNRGRTPHTH